jgi:hypothetical protein
VARIGISIDGACVGREGTGEKIASGSAVRNEEPELRTRKKGKET